MDAVRLTLRRIGAYVVDVTAVAIVVVPIASAVAFALGTDDLAGREVWLRSVVLVSIPAWTYFIVTEHRGGGGFGKRVVGLQTNACGTDAFPTWGAATVRTAVTLAPWELSHLAFFGLAARVGEVTAGQVAVAVAAYALLAGFVIITYRTEGRRSPADLAAGTEVRGRGEAAA
jgi:hypothetical protein